MEFENLLTLIKAVSDSELTEFEYEENGANFHFKKEKEKVVVSENFSEASSECLSAAQIKAEKQIQNNLDGTTEPEGNLIKSPLVGTFYAAPSEDAEAFVAVGDTVKKGQTLAIVEAMKLMNEIESDFDGKVAEIYVENGQAVEYGQPLFRIV